MPRQRPVGPSGCYEYDIRFLMPQTTCPLCDSPELTQYRGKCNELLCAKCAEKERNQTKGGDNG